MFYIFPLRSRVAKINLSIAFKDKNNKEINTILKNTYKHFGKLTIEFIRMYTVRLDDETIEFDKSFEKNLLSDNGIIFMTAHFGNWEVITSLLHKFRQVTAIAKEQNNNGGDKFFNECRLLDNVSLISNKGSKRKMLKSLIDKKILLIASDQNAKKHGNYIDFFGKPCSIPKGAGHFYSSTKSKLLIGFCILKEDLTYYLEIKNIELKNKSEQKQDIIVEINTIYSKMLEDIIKRYPEQYFWFHKKWDKEIYKQ
jgi:KDO2-lipid IV(A) lauroyltransferase